MAALIGDAAEYVWPSGYNPRYRLRRIGMAIKGFSCLPWWGPERAFPMSGSQSEPVCLSFNRSGLPSTVEGSKVKVFPSTLRSQARAQAARGTKTTTSGVS